MAGTYMFNEQNVIERCNNDVILWHYNHTAKILEFVRTETFRYGPFRYRHLDAKNSITFKQHVLCTCYRNTVIASRIELVSENNYIATVIFP